MRKSGLAVLLCSVALALGAWTPPPAKLLPQTRVPEFSSARWIWLRSTGHTERTTAAIRHAFTVENRVKSVRFRAACDDSGKVFFNGTELRHEPEDILNSDRFVRTYNVPKELVRKGRNAISAEVYNAETFGGLILSGEVVLESGGRIPLVSNGDWRAMELPVKGDWKSPDFDDSRWGHAMELGGVMIYPWRTACRRLFELMLSPEEHAAFRKLMDGKLANLDFLRDAPDTKGRIVWRNGRAGIEINGRVEAPLLYLAGGSPWAEHNADAIIKMNSVGVKFIEIQNNAADFMMAPGKYDFSRLGDDMRRAVALAPDATFCLGMGFHFGYSPWHKFHPDALIGYATGPADGKGGQLGRFKSPSMADPRTYREMEAFATQLMDYVKKQPWYKRVTMVRLNHGVTAEWHYYGMSRDMPDTSPEMTAAFRKYLRGKYADDEALRRAWHDKAVTLETARVPGAAERFGKYRFLRDPASPDRQVLDYYDCMQEVVADLLLHFTGCVKKADPRLIVGVYYGYLFHMAFPPEGQVLRFEKVLASPNVDFLSSPFSYDAASRFVGGDVNPRAVSDPFKKYGKLIMYEADTRTHIAGVDVTATSCCRNITDSVAVLRNNIGRAFLDGGGVQFLEFGARFGREAWLNHPELYRTLRQALALWRGLWEAAEPDPAAEVAVVVSPEEFVRQGYPTREFQLQCIPNIIDKPVHALLRSGVSCDQMTLQGFLESPHEYKVVVLLNVFSPSARERKALLAKLRRPGVTAVWNYAPGLVTDEGYSDAAMSGLCGITLGSRREKLPMAVKLRDGGRLASLWVKKPWRESPRCFVADPAAEILGSYEELPEPAVAFKTLADGSNAVFCGMPGITEEFWRMLWKKLGIPTVSAPGSVVAAGNSRHLLVHTGKAGKFELRLPGAARATELFTRAEYPVENGVLTLKADGARTWFLEIGAR